MAVGAIIATAGVLGVVQSLNQGRFAERQAEYAASMSRVQAEMAVISGQSQAARALAEGRRVRSAQRSGLAAGGIDVGVGTAADLQEETDIIAEANANRAIQAAALEGYGFSSQAAQQDVSGAVSRARGIGQAATTALTTAGALVERGTRQRSLLNGGS